MNSTRQHRNSTLLVGSRDESFATDKPMLRSSGAGRMFFMPKGIKAATELALMEQGSLPSFIVCSEPEDMDNLSFLRLLRLHPKLFNLPVLLICSELKKDALLEAVSLGYASVLVRPYTQKDLDAAILNAIKISSKTLSPASDSKTFEQAVSSMSLPCEARDTAVLRPLGAHGPHVSHSEVRTSGLVNAQRTKEKNDDLLLKANGLLRCGKFKEAIGALGSFLSSAQAAHNKGDALQGMAEAYAGLGMLEDEHAFLQRAAAAYLNDNDFSSARLIFSRLYPQEERNAKDNPLYKAGAKLLQQAEYSLAAQAFLQGYAFTPEEFFAAAIARSCQLSPSPLEYTEGICRAVAQRSPSTGRVLRANLLPKERPAQIEEKEGFWGMIGEALTVACHTAKVVWS